MKINEFRQNSDYGTLKNDTSGNSISASLVSGTDFNISSPLLASATLNVGTINAGIRARGKSSKYTPWANGITVYSDFLYSIPSLGPTTYTGALYCNLQRISANTIRLTLATEGGTGGPDFRIQENQTITFVFSTFLSPFD